MQARSFRRQNSSPYPIDQSIRYWDVFEDSNSGNNSVRRPTSPVPVFEAEYDPSTDPLIREMRDSHGGKPGWTEERRIRANERRIGTKEARAKFQRIGYPGPTGLRTIKEDLRLKAKPNRLDDYYPKEFVGYPSRQTQAFPTRYDSRPRMRPSLSSQPVYTPQSFSRPISLPQPIGSGIGRGYDPSTDPLIREMRERHGSKPGWTQERRIRANERRIGTKEARAKFQRIGYPGPTGLRTIKEDLRLKAKPNRLDDYYPKEFVGYPPR